MTNLKQYTVVASGKMRDVAFEKLEIGRASCRERVLQ